ncbi:MAG TPA: TolC family protein, partial [Spirochaetota bacterium]|nr:TolC family protein [Spirochaetota bacterium]
SRNDYRIALNLLIMEIRNSYFQVLQLRDSIEIHKKTLEHGLMQLKFITKEYELGDATKFDKLEIETKVKEIEYNLEKACDEYIAALNQFKFLLKIDWRHPIEVAGSIQDDFSIRPVSRKYDLDYMASLAMKNRKEVESADVDLLVKKKSYLMNELYYFPTFAINLNYSLTDDKFMPRKKGWGIGFEVSAALFGSSGNVNSTYRKDDNNNSRSVTNSGSANILDNMAYKRNIVESKIELNRANDSAQQIRQQVALEISTAFSALNNSWEMIGISRKRLELYDTQLVIERLKANMGESRRYDLMKKEIERGEAAIAHLASLVRYLVSASTLETSMGADIGFLQVSKYSKKYTGKIKNGGNGHEAIQKK